MQVELTGGDYDFARLQRYRIKSSARPMRRRPCENVFTAFQALRPAGIDQGEHHPGRDLNVNAGDIYNALQSYMGSTYVNLFTRFGHDYMVYVQADPQQRLNTDDIKHLLCAVQSR